MVWFFCKGRQFLLSFKIVNRIFENFLVDEKEIFVNFCINEGAKASFW